MQEQDEEKGQKDVPGCRQARTTARATEATAGPGVACRQGGDPRKGRGCRCDAGLRLRMFYMCATG